MRLDDVPGFVAYYPCEADTTRLCFPCGDWAFVFPNNILAAVSRRADTPGGPDGRYVLGALHRGVNRFITALPENPMWGIEADEAIDWLYHISILDEAGEAAHAMRYPIAHFLHKFRSIAESGWCEHEEMKGHGRKSVMGWLGVTDTFYMTPEAEALGDIFGDTMIAMGIAEGLDPRYEGTPRTMIIEALEDQLASRNRVRELAKIASRHMYRKQPGG